MRRLIVPALLATLATAAWAQTSWPPFLPPASTFATDVARTVEQVWSKPTLDRSVAAKLAPVPATAYIAFFDVPEVTAAAARHLKLARYDVRARDDDTYEADDHEGSRGVYQVLARDGGRRVVLSRGSHTGPLLGTVTGRAVTVLDVEGDGGRTAPRLTAYVVIDNRVAAAIARVLQFAFGYLADRKLAEGLEVTARVVAWAIDRPDEFCPWLERTDVPAARREPLLAVLPECSPASASPRAPAR